MSAKYILLIIATMALSGCALQQRLQQADKNYQDTKNLVMENHGLFSKSLDNDKTAAQTVDKPWVIGKAQPLARELTLPLPLRNKVTTTLLFSDSDTDLKKIASRITRVANIPVYVRPDALLPAWQFLPKTIGDISAYRSQNNIAQPFELSNGPEPLATILDRIGSFFGIRWRYTNNRIEFYRTETRVFNVQALSLNAKTSASLGLNQDTASTGFISSSNTSLTSNKLDVMATVRARLEPFLTRAGVLVAQAGATSSVVVTDTPEALDNIAKYLEKENRILTRRVRLVFEEITVALTEKDQASIDWNIVFSGASLMAGAAIPGIPAAQAANIGLGITRGKFSGSEAVIKALGESVRLVRRSSVPMMTLNRRPVTHAVRTTFSYIDKIETTPISNSNGLAVPAVSVNQKEETVGSLLTLVPDVQDDGRILLSLAYDNTVAQPLKTITFGDKSNPLQLQQLTVEGNGTVQQLALQPGQPLVVSGFDRQQSENTKKRLSTGLPAIFGGGDALNTQRLTTILVITAQVEEGL